MAPTGWYVLVWAGEAREDACGAKATWSLGTGNFCRVPLTQEPGSGSARPGLDVGSPGALRWWDSNCELVGTGRTGRAACPLPALLGHGRHLLLREHPWVPQHPPPPSPLPLPSPPPSVLTPLTLISTFTCMGTPQVRGQAHGHGSPPCHELLWTVSSTMVMGAPWWGHPLGAGTAPWLCVLEKQMRPPRLLCPSLLQPHTPLCPQAPLVIPTPSPFTPSQQHPASLHSSILLFLLPVPLG